MQPDSPSHSIVLGRALVKTGQLDEAEQHFQRVLEVEPAHAEALDFMIQRVLARGDHPAVVALIEPAVAAGASDARLFKWLGFAHLSNGNSTSAQTALSQSLALDPQQYLVWLKLGQLQEEAGRLPEALVAYFRAVTTAQQQGRWLNDATTGPKMRERVKHAMRFIDAGRSRLYFAALEPLRRKHGRAALERIERCVAEYLGQEPSSYAHPLQRPTFLHVPGLPSTAFLPRELFPWLDELEANAAAIREEALAMLAADSVLEPFLGEGSDGAATGQLRSDRGGKASWDALFFYRHGKRNDANCARCPVTAAVLDRLPLVRIDEHAPEILFSVLTPGSEIMPHTGVTNARLVAHLALVIPDDCAIRVGGEQRAWEQGQAFVFDDTYVHEAWNRSDETRVVLILDAWNPYLTEVEKEAFSELVLAISAFHHACGIASDAEKIEAKKAQGAARISS